MSQQLEKSAITFEPSAWSGSGFGAGEDMEVGVTFRQITGGLAQGSAGSLESLVFGPGSEGIVGGVDAGHLVVDIANSADAKLQNLGKVDLRVEAASGSKVENLHTGNSRAKTRCLGGEFETTSISSGRLTMNESCVVDEFIGLGGRSTIEYNATAIADMLTVSGGEHTIKRRADTIDLAGGMLILDHSSQLSSWTGDAINIRNGTLKILRGTIPSINIYDGVLDLSGLRENIGSSLGATAFNVWGGKIIKSPLATINPTFKGAIYRNDDNVINAGSGGFQPI